MNDAAMEFVLRALVVNRHRPLDYDELAVFARAARIVSEAGLPVPAELRDGVAIYGGQVGGGMSAGCQTKA